MLVWEVGTVSDADPVRLAEAPNVVFAESPCGMLRSNGIEAFYKQSGPGLGLGFTTSDFAPADIWVSAADVERARALLPEG
jgi:Putative prokaryotic signal transducing protein